MKPIWKIQSVTVLLIVMIIVTASSSVEAKPSSTKSKNTSFKVLTQIIDIAYDGGTNTVALQEDGTVWYWLGGEKAQRGPTIPGAIKVTAGNLVLKKDGTVWEWDSKTYQVTQISELHDIVEIQSSNLALDKNDTLWVKGDSTQSSLVLGKDINADTSTPRPQGDDDVVLKFERGLEHIKTMAVGKSGDIGLVKQDGTIEHYYSKYGFPELTYGKFTYRLPSNLTPDDIHIQETFDRFNDGYLDSVTVVANDSSLWYGDREKTFRRYYGSPKVKLTATSGSLISRGGYSELYALDQHNNLLGIEALRDVVIKDGEIKDGKKGFYANVIKYNNVKNVKKVISRWQNSALALKNDGTIWEWGPNKASYQDYLVLTSLEPTIQPTPIEKAITVRWNGQLLPLSSPPVMQKSLMVPMRELFEAFGSTVQYNNGHIVVQQGSHHIELKVYKHEATVNGKNVKLTEAPTYIQGKTYVPLRFVAQSLGANVAWDDKEQIVTIKYSK